MKLFQQLFGLHSAEVTQTERRLQGRYPTGADFPLTVAVAGDGWNGTGRAHDLAVGGIGVVLDRGPTVDTGANVRVGLRLDGFEILTGGLLRHTRPRSSRGVNCGVSLIFEDSAAQHAYVQLLIPVSIGGSLAPLDAARVRQDEPGVHKAAYAGDSASRLTVWSRTKKGDRPGPFSFEFSVGEHLVRGREGTAGVQTFSRVDDQRPHRATDFAPHAGDAMDAELKRLFRWSVLNIRESVPAAERKFVLSFAE